MTCENFDELTDAQRGSGFPYKQGVSLLSHNVSSDKDRRVLNDNLKNIACMTEYLRDTISGISLPTEQYVAFDGGVLGPLAPKFFHRRNIATKDGLGIPVAADEPRYDRPSLWIEPTSNTNTLVYPSTSSNLSYAAGKDFNGTTDLAVLWEATSNNFQVFRGDLTTPYVTNNLASFGADFMRGTIAGQTFISKAYVVCHGAILVMASRRVAGSDQGVALLISTDYGASFSIVQDAAVSNGLPNRVVGLARGTNFSMQHYWAAEGEGSQPKDVWLVFTDYQVAPATGGQVGLARITRSTTSSSDWVDHGCRLILEYDGYPATTHFHCAGLTEVDGILRIVTSIGDTTDDNKIVLDAIDVSSDRDDYMTNPITHNDQFHGSSNADVTGLGLFANQFTGIAPGPDPLSFIVTSDFNNDPVTILRLPAISVVGDAATIKAEISHLHGFRSAENFCIICRDPFARTDYISGDRPATTNRLYYSPDGEHWADLIWRTGGGVPFTGWFGNKIIHVWPSAGLYQIDRPESDIMRPLLVGPGGINRVGAHSQWTAAESGVTRVLYAPNGSGLYEYPAGHPRAGQVLDTQPLSMTEVWRYISDGTNDDGGFRYLSAITPPSFSGTDQSMLAEVFSLDHSGAELRVLADGAATNNQITSACNNSWMPSHFNGNLSINARPAMKVQFRSGTVTKPGDCLVTISSHKSGANGIGYPIAPDTLTATPNTEAGLTAVELVDDWSVSAYLGQPYVGDILDTNSNYLITIVKDASNYVEVYRSASNVVTLNVVVAGVPTSDTVDVILNKSEYGAFYKITVSESLGNTTLNFSGLLNDSCTVAAAIGSGTADINFSANKDFSVVGINRIFKVGVSI